MGAKLIIFLIIQYVVIMGVYAYQKNWPMVVYWFGAIVLNIGVLWGMG